MIGFSVSVAYFIVLALARSIAAVLWAEILRAIGIGLVTYLGISFLIVDAAPGRRRRGALPTRAIGFGVRRAQRRPAGASFGYPSLSVACALLIRLGLVRFSSPPRAGMIFPTAASTAFFYLFSTTLQRALNNRYLRTGSSETAETGGARFQTGGGLLGDQISMKFRPLHDRVVIRRIEGEDKTKGGIIIPDTVKEKPQEGEVVAVGPGARDESGKLSRSNSKRATGCCSANGPARRSRSTARTS